MQLLKNSIDNFFESGEDAFFDQRVVSVSSLKREFKLLNIEININMNFFTVKVKGMGNDTPFDSLLRESIKHALTTIIMDNAFKRNLIIAELKYDFDVIENPEIIAGLERNIPITFN